VQYNNIPAYRDIPMRYPRREAALRLEAGRLLSPVQVPRLIALIYGRRSSGLYPYSSMPKRLLTTAGTTLRVEFGLVIAINA
jgi:hypothetical protein